MKPSWIRLGVFLAILTVWAGIVFAVSYVVTGMLVRMEIPPPIPYYPRYSTVTP